MKFKTYIWALLLCFIVAFAARTVLAATVNLPQTGQTTSYSTGDDGYIKAGAPWPGPRFTDNGDQTMTDNLTGLVWTKDGGTPNYGSCTGGSMYWTSAFSASPNAFDYVACLNTANYLGHNDWRLPNINELESLLNAGQGDSAIWLNTQGFIHVRSDVYWSSTNDAQYNGVSWVVDTRGLMWYRWGWESTSYVWPVRTGQSGSFDNAAIWKTGQTTSHYARDDGALQTGVAWPSPRFTNPDGSIPVTGSVVVDQLTGLMWTKNANLPGGYKHWQQALDYVASMNAGAGTYGYTDWRLPNKKELRSLVDYSQWGPALPVGNPFTNVQYQGIGYWSSTTKAYIPGYAFHVSINEGKWASDDESSYSFYVWPVRGGLVNNSVNLVILPSGTGSGTVTSSETTPRINCPGTCSATYNQSITTTLTATASSGSIFTGWSGGGCSGTDPCILASSAAAAVTATFTNPNLPGTATLVSPTGANITTTPTYTWNAVSNATWYYLWVNDSTGTAV
ncbi:MAG: DUF1566 domain-containing protein, partial [Nitrospirae bacterium]|nr:DUF1566 domain-containing protein [Nitrospirota bacterium]